MPLIPNDIKTRLARSAYDDKVHQFDYHSAVPYDFEKYTLRWSGEQPRLDDILKEIIAGDNFWDRHLKNHGQLGTIAHLSGGGGSIGSANGTYSYSRDLRGTAFQDLTISKHLYALEYTLLNYCSFEKCKFDAQPSSKRYPEMLFFMNEIKHSRFDDCSFENVAFWNGTYDHIVFSSCNFTNTFFNCNPSDRNYGFLLFLNCKFTDADFRRISLETCCFVNPVFAGKIQFDSKTFPRGLSPIGSSIIESCRTWDKESYARRCETKSVTYAGLAPPNPTLYLPGEKRKFVPKYPSVSFCYAGISELYRSLNEQTVAHEDFVKFHYLFNWTRDQSEFHLKFEPRFLKRAFARYVLGYGDIPARPLIIWLVMNFAFSWLYLFLGFYYDNQLIKRCLSFDSSEVWGTLHDIGISAYFSVITSTTVGFGDIHPAMGWPMFCTCIEAVCGILLMTMFTVIFARRFFR